MNMLKIIMFLAFGLAKLHDFVWFIRIRKTIYSQILQKKIFSGKYKNVMIICDSVVN